MPGGNRRISRTMLRNTMPPIIPSFSGEGASAKYSPLGAPVPTLPGVDQPVAPKHFLFPNTPVDGDLFFEAILFLFGSISMGLQYLHLYRTVWWLPHSYSRHTVNFYLIDLHLVAFILILLSRRLVYILGCKILDQVLSSRFQEFGYLCYRLFLFGLICGILSFRGYHIIQNYQLVNIFYLYYPISVYVILFGFKVSPFFELVNWNSEDMPPLHACTSNPNDIRQEVENLKTNFNNRMKQILFSSVLNSYYAGFIPCCFAPNFLHYDVYWATQHAIFIFLSSFMAHTVHILHLRYCDVLHRSALHLGHWYKMDPRNSLAYHWTEDLLWPANTVARHGRELYRSQGECNAAEPGNSSYSRFYMIFRNPSTPLSFLITLHVLMVSFQLGLLIRCTFWYNIVSLTFMLFFNYLILYKIVRDYLISYKIYKEEKIIHEKINMQ